MSHNNWDALYVEENINSSVTIKKKMIIKGMQKSNNMPISFANIDLFQYLNIKYL